MGKALRIGGNSGLVTDLVTTGGAMDGGFTISFPGLAEEPLTSLEVPSEGLALTFPSSTPRILRHCLASWLN